MKYKYGILLLLSATTSLLLTDCKKKDDAPPDCRIITASSDIESYNFTYDTERRLASVLTLPTNQMSVFEYSGNIVTITSTENGGTFVLRQIVTLNERGFAANMRMETNQSGTKWFNKAYQYNGTQIIKSTNTSSAGPSSVTEYFWENGNLKSAKLGGSTISYEYYLDKPYQSGDYRYLLELIGMEKLYDNKNLTKSLVVDGETTLFTYTFDDQGKISSITFTNANKIVWDTDR